MKAFLVLLVILCSACTPLINVSINNGGDTSRQSIKGDADQTPSTPVNAAIPVSVGAQPNSTGTVGK